MIISLLLWHSQIRNFYGMLMCCDKISNKARAKISRRSPFSDFDSTWRWGTLGRWGNPLRWNNPLRWGLKRTLLYRQSYYPFNTWTRKMLANHVFWLFCTHLLLLLQLSVLLLSIVNQIKMRDYMDRRVTSPSWGPPPSWKKTLRVQIWHFASSPSWLQQYNAFLIWSGTFAKFTS